MVTTCTVCGVTSDAAEFYAGVNSRCKECHKKRVRENRASKIDYYKVYDRVRYQNDPRVKDRHKRYKATDGGKEATSRSRQKWLNGNADKHACYVILNNAVRDGRVSKPTCCQNCGSNGRIEGHHHDYAYPLDVIWLCPKCHHRLHAAFPEVEGKNKVGAA